MKLIDVKVFLDPLVQVGVICLPRDSVYDPIKEIDGPIIDTNCKHSVVNVLAFWEKK